MPIDVDIPIATHFAVKPDQLPSAWHWPLVEKYDELAIRYPLLHVYMTVDRYFVDVELAVPLPIFTGEPQSVKHERSNITLHIQFIIHGIMFINYNDNASVNKLSRGIK